MIKIGDLVKCEKSGEIGTVVAFYGTEKFPLKVRFCDTIFSYKKDGSGPGITNPDLLPYRDEVMRTCRDFTIEPLEKKLSLGGLGVSGEAGEVADLIKKVLHHEVSLDSVKDKLIKEIGDVYWYLEYLCASIGVTSEQVKNENIKKNRLRHPNGWSPQSQQAKADEAHHG